MTDSCNHPLLEERKGELIGKHPDKVTISELNDAGHTNTSPTQAIRKHCLECSGFQPGEVRKCVSITCPLWAFRMGKSPFRSHDAKEKGHEVPAKAEERLEIQLNIW